MERREIVILLEEKFHKYHCLLQQIKTDAEKWGKHPDWPWNGLVMSAATLGGSRRWERNVQPRYDKELSWLALESVSDCERKRRLETVGRYWERTAKSLMALYEAIRDKGGPELFRGQLATKDAEQITIFWKSFSGIGDKYARNIMMDVYDSRFRNGYFAIDRRITGLLPALGYHGPHRYEAQEVFLNSLASDAGIESWELDRLLYQAHKEFMEISTQHKTEHSEKINICHLC